MVTINDGPAGETGLTEHVLRNDDGFFVDATEEWWPAAANPGYDDNLVAFLDVESDGACKLPEDEDEPPGASRA